MQKLINEGRVAEKIILTLFWIVAILSIDQLVAYNYFSPLHKVERFFVIEDNRVFELRNKPVIVDSEIVSSDSLILKKGEDYQLDYSTGRISFPKEFENVIVEYQVYPDQFKTRFFLYEEQSYSEDKKIKSPPRFDDIFSNQTKLQISGSKTIMVSVSNEQDFSLNQSLYLRLDGELSNNLFIEAQLSDSQSPITPEGDSRELSSLDKVFLRVFTQNYELAFGDLEVEYQNTEFINYTPRFEGIRLTWQKNFHIQTALALTRGKSASTSFFASEAKQGPYYIRTDSGDITQIVASSESVFLNGALMNRGDDYIIDYSEGSITFHIKHFLSAASLIQINYQFTDENFQQNIYLASSDVMLTNSIRWRNYFIFQVDDKNSPFQQDLSASDIDSLQNAGDNIVWGSGASEVENGDYLLSEDGYYIYVGSDSTLTGDYSIHFEFVGINNGDYEYNSQENFYFFVGLLQGSYLPIKKLTAPQKTLNYDFVLDYEKDFFHLSAETIFTQHDKNTFSNLDDDDNNSFASKIGIALKPDWDRIKPDFQMSYRLVSQNLRSFAQLTDPLSSYDAVQIPDSLANRSWQTLLRVNWFDQFEHGFLYRNSFAEDFAKQDYLSSDLNFKQGRFLPQIYYRFSYLDRVYDDQRNELFFQHAFKAQKKIAFLNFRSVFDQKNTDIEASESDQRRSIQNLLVAVQTVSSNKFTSELTWHRQEQKDESAAETTYQTTSQTTGLSAILNQNNQTGKIQYSHRVIEDDLADSRKSFDIADFSFRSSLLKNGITFSSAYNFHNVEFYPKIKDFLYVGSNMGSFDEDSLYVGFGEGDYEWKIVAIDYENPQMSVEVNTNLNAYFNPGMFLNGFWKRWKTELIWQISENSTAADKKRIYLLDPAILMNDETTLFGRNLLQNTLWFNIIDNRLSSKFRYQDENILDNRYNEVSEKTRTKSQEGTLRLNFIQNMSVELGYANDRTRESRYTSSSETKVYSLELRNQIHSDADLRSLLEYGKEDGKKEDESNFYELRYYRITETITYFLKSRYRFFGKLVLKKNERKGSQFLSFLDDKKEGMILKWNLNMDYKMSAVASAQLSYSGQSVPDKQTEHKLSLELKAEF